MNILHAGDLVLEPQVAAHAAPMFAVLSDPAIYEFENVPPESLAWLEHRFRRLESRQSADGSQQWLNWVVRLPSGELAGYVQATVMHGGAALIAYELASRFWRQGIGSRAVRAVLAELSARYGVQTFAAVLKARNFRSAALLRGLGFEAGAPAGMASLACDADELVMGLAHNPQLPGHMTAGGPSMLKTYRGSCHCGAVRFEADLDLGQSTYRCNCSICRRTRFWAAVATPEGFRLLSGESELTQYLFNTKKNQHYFCRHCGVRAFGVGTETPIGKMYGVNLGCLEDVSEEEFARIPVTCVDGRNDRFAAPTPDPSSGHPGDCP